MLFRRTRGYFSSRKLLAQERIYLAIISSLQRSEIFIALESQVILHSVGGRCILLTEFTLFVQSLQSNSHIALLWSARSFSFGAINMALLRSGEFCGASLARRVQKLPLCLSLGG